MNILLDTHAFLWWAGDPSRLSARVLNLCKDPEVVVWFSIASIWEVQIKHQIGRLTLTAGLPDIVALALALPNFRLLPLSLPHIFALAALPMHHRDPFDRIILAQAVSENLPIASVDEYFPAYPVSLIW